MYTTSAVAWKPNCLVIAPEPFSTIYEKRIYMTIFTVPIEEIVRNNGVYEICTQMLTGKTIKGDTYKQIQKALLSVMELKVSILKGGKNVKNLAFIKDTEYVEGKRKDKIRLTLHEDIVEMLKAGDKTGYTKIPYSFCLKTSSLNQLKFIELMLMFSEYEKKVDFSIDNLKSTLGIPETKYKEWDSFNKRIVKPSVSLHNKIADVKFICNQIKKKRKVVKISLSKDHIDDKNTQKDIPEDRKTLLGIVNEHIWEKHREYILNNYSAQHISYYHKKCHEEAAKGKIKNINSFIYKAIIDDHDNFSEKLKKKKEIEKKKKVRQAVLNDKQNKEDQFFDFAKECFNVLNKETQDRYKAKVNFYIGGDILSVAVGLLIKDHKSLMMGCKSPDEFIKAYEGLPS